MPGEAFDRTNSLLNSLLTELEQKLESADATLVSGKTLKVAVGSDTVTDQIIAAVASKKLKVFAYQLQSQSDTMTASLRDGAAGSILTPVWTFNSREGVAIGPTNPPEFLLATTAGNRLDIVITGTGTIVWGVYYWDDDAS